MLTPTRLLLVPAVLQVSFQLPRQPAVWTVRKESSTTWAHRIRVNPAQRVTIRTCALHHVHSAQLVRSTATATHQPSVCSARPVRLQRLESQARMAARIALLGSTMTTVPRATVLRHHACCVRQAKCSLQLRPPSVSTVLQAGINTLQGKQFALIVRWVPTSTSQPVMTRQTARIASPASISMSQAAMTPATASTVWLENTSIAQVPTVQVIASHALRATMWKKRGATKSATALRALPASMRPTQPTPSRVTAPTVQPGSTARR